MTVSIKNRIRCTVLVTLVTYNTICLKVLTINPPETYAGLTRTRRFDAWRWERAWRLAIVLMCHYDCPCNAQGKWAMTGNKLHNQMNIYTRFISRLRLLSPGSFWRLTSGRICLFVLTWYDWLAAPAQMTSSPIQSERAAFLLRVRAALRKTSRCALVPVTLTKTLPQRYDSVDTWSLQTVSWWFKVTALYSKDEKKPPRSKPVALLSSSEFRSCFLPFRKGMVGNIICGTGSCYFDAAASTPNQTASRAHCRQKRLFIQKWFVR